MQKGRASPWGEVASRSDGGEGFAIRKREYSRPLSVALRAPAPLEGSLSLHSAQIQNLQSYGLCGILDIEKDNRPQRWVAKEKKFLESHFLTRKV